jgi:predicted nucleic acid-binding protein
LKLWPADERTAVEFAAIMDELRTAGVSLAQFDALIAAVARQNGFTLLTADRDFRSVGGIRIESWLP